MPQLRDGGVAGFKVLIGLDGERRDLARSGQLWTATPIPIATQSVDVGQNPGRDHKVRLFARLAEQIEAHCHAFRFQANQKIFSGGNELNSGGWCVLTGYGFNEGGGSERGELSPR